MLILISQKLLEISHIFEITDKICEKTSILISGTSDYNVTPSPLLIIGENLRRVHFWNIGMTLPFSRLWATS